MITECDPVDLTQVPTDLLDQNPGIRRFHEWKAATVVRACVPLSRFCTAPKASEPGILMYHRVVPEGSKQRPTWNVTPDRFRDQLSGLQRQGYAAWSLSRLVSAAANDEKIEDNVFVVTFDDGYANNFLHALPILEELGIPATVFLATAYLNSAAPFPFDDWCDKGRSDVSPDAWRPLTLNECHEMLKSDLIEFGSHTHTHEDFRNRPEAFHDNLQLSAGVLKQEFGLERPLLSLPYGIISRGFAGPSYFSTAKALNFGCCLTTEEQLIPHGTSPFGWGRFIAEQHDTAGTLGVKLDGWRDAVRNQWRRIRGCR